MSNTIKYFPIKVLLGFLVFTEVLLFLGPEEFDFQYPFLLFVYLIILNIALYKGFKKGVDNYYTREVVEKPSDLLTLKFFIFTALFISFFNLVSNWGLSSISPGAILDRFLEGLNSPADAYTSNLGPLYSTEKSTFNTLFFALLSPITFAAIPLGIFYWEKLSRNYRIIVVALVFLEVIYWIGIGTRKGLLDIILIVTFILIAKNPQYIEDKSKRRKAFLVLFLFLSAFIFYFVYSNLARYSVKLGDVADLESLPINVDIKPFYENNIPPYLYYPFLTISDYLCQGYYALSCALKLSLTDPVFTFGIGNNSFVMVILDRILGIDYDYLMSFTYQWKLYELYDIHPSINWHSIYVWLANDFTFLGVPFVVYFIGKYLSTTWMDTLYQNNFYSAPLFSLFAIMVFYFFANNQVLSSQFVAFVVIFILYFFRRYKFVN
jgi:hypothetical protein